jgi:hypothetical protein
VRLSSQQRSQFLARGYVKLDQAVPAGFREESTQDIWTRLGYDEHRPETWNELKVHMPAQRSWPARRVVPEVVAAMEELVSPGRLSDPVLWNDSFVVNLGLGSDRPWQGLSTRQPGWHKDGDFFRHFLDSPEQALLVIVLYSDVAHQGGATVFLPDSVGPVARHLAAHPEGRLPKEIDYQGIVAQCGEVVEAIGKAGDVYLLHPFMVHAESQNVLRAPRFIANPGVGLVEPMSYSRSGGAYSLVEEGVLRGLGVSSLAFEATGPRQPVVPDRIARQAQRKALEDARLDGVNEP